jgi:predicted nucleotidyltransferase
MSVLTHLEAVASKSKIADWERIPIDTSITTLTTKLTNYFNNVEDKFVFGSYQRKTILRRSIDANSDVDYMVVFNDGAQFTPQTLMTRLKTFADAKYDKEIYQSSPTIVLELSNIKFELTPAYKSWGTLYIPAPASGYADWISTDPGKVNSDLNEKHRNNDYLIRDLVLVLKYWNVKNGKVYTSYELEQYIISKWFFSCSNLKDYFYSAVAGLSTFNLPDYKKNKVLSLQTKIQNTKNYENNGMPTSAEIELKKALP